MLTGCISVMNNLRHRGLKGDMFCARCGNDSESVNHAFFECPPARQVWLLSTACIPQELLLTSSVFTILDYLFWRQPKDRYNNAYPWLLWYIWKSRNDKVFSNIDWDPRVLIKMAESEAQIWELSQSERIVPPAVGTTIADLPMVTQNVKCFVDGSWKASESLMGLGWIGFSGPMNERLMGARAIRRSESPLHAEFEALLWAMEWMASNNKVSVVFFSDSLELVKMVTSPEDWPTFSLYLLEVERLREIITDFAIHHVPRTYNTEADSLARGARKFSVTARYVNDVPPAWLFRLG